MVVVIEQADLTSWQCAFAHSVEALLLQQSIQYLLLSSHLFRQRREPIKRPLITTMIAARVYKGQSNDPVHTGQFT